MAPSIALFTGMEEDFPTALEAACRDLGLAVERPRLLALDPEATLDHDLVLDRISHEVRFYRSWMLQAALGGARVVNDPLLVHGTDRFSDLVVAKSLGIPVPRARLLPSKEHPATTTQASLGNLGYPVPWDEVLASVGRPAELVPVGLGGPRVPVEVDSVDELLRAYDASGEMPLLLREVWRPESTWRAHVFGAVSVVPVPWDVDGGRARLDDEELDPEPLEQLVSMATRMAAALGYELCAMEFELVEGELRLARFVNPIPKLERSVLGPLWFRRVVETAASHLGELAEDPSRALRGERGLTAPMRLSARLSGPGDPPPPPPAGLSERNTEEGSPA